MHLARVMKVLEAVAMAGRPVTASEVQQLTDLPRPTCYRLLHSMQAEQLLDEVSSGRFIAGESLVRLALLGQTDVDICRCAAPTLQRAADDLGEAVFLSRFRNRGVEIIHVEVPGDAKRSFVHPGFTISSITSSLSDLTASLCEKSNLRRSGATREPFCAT